MKTIIMPDSIDCAPYPCARPADPTFWPITWSGFQSGPAGWATVILDQLGDVRTVEAVHWVLGDLSMHPCKSTTCWRSPRSFSGVTAVPVPRLPRCGCNQSPIGPESAVLGRLCREGARRKEKRRPPRKTAGAVQSGEPLRLDAAGHRYAGSHSPVLNCPIYGGRSHPRLSPTHDAPETGCKRWSFAAGADRDIWTCEDWHVNASREVPGYVDAPRNRYRAPLSGADIRRLYDFPGESWDDVRASIAKLAWEIGRERDFNCRLRHALPAMAQEPKTPLQTRIYLRRLAERTLEDPGVREEIERQTMMDAITHQGE